MTPGGAAARSIPTELAQLIQTLYRDARGLSGRVRSFRDRAAAGPLQSEAFGIQTDFSVILAQLAKANALVAAATMNGDVAPATVPVTSLELHPSNLPLPLPDHVDWRKRQAHDHTLEEPDTEGRS